MKDTLRTMFKAFLPISQRYKGSLEIQVNFYKMKLEDIKAPTIVIHSEDDNVAPISWGEYAAQNIKNSKFVTFKTGGHIMLGHMREVREEVIKFIQEIDYK